MRADLQHYCRVAVKVRNEEGQLVPFVWRRAQVEVHSKIEQQRELTGRVRAIVLKGRKLGVSTYVGARFYHKTTLAPGRGQRTHIQTHEDPSTQVLFDIVKTIHRHMPGDYKLTAGRSNQTELIFPTVASGYVVSTAKNVSGVGRGSTPHNLHASEAGFWPHSDIHFAGIVNAVPDAPRSEIIIESTANGLEGEFYEQWVKAEAGDSEYVPIFIPWWWHTGYRRPLTRDYEPSLEEEDYGRLYGLDDEQICWMHYKNITPLGGQPGKLGVKFKQEFPANPQEAFQGGAEDSLISSELVMKARQNDLDSDPYAARVLGVDMAQGGEDKTHLIDREGRRAGYLVNESFDNSDDDIALAEKIARLIRFHGFQKVFIDMSPGKTLVDLLHRNGFREEVTGVAFGAKPVELDKYMNKRAEMWGDMRDWLKYPGGADLPDDNELHRHLCAPGYKYTDKSRILLEPKEKIRKRLKCSPDRGDALALTFAETVIKPIPRENSWIDDLHVGGDGGGFMVQ